MSDNEKKSTIDTGTGGFELDGQTYTYDVGTPDSEGGPHGAHDKGKINVDAAPKDLSTPTRTRLGQYLSEVTAGIKGDAKTMNVYPIAYATKTSSTTDVDGSTPALEAPPDNQAAFAQNVDSYRSDTYGSVNNVIKKGKSRGAGVDGNKLLPSADVNAVAATEPVGTYVSQVLKSNRFGNNVYGSIRPTSTSTADATKVDLDQVDSRYNPTLNRGTVMGSSPLQEGKQELYSIERLASIGPTLMLRASGELGAGDANFNPNSSAASAGALLPGSTQLGVQRIEQLRLNAKDVLESLTTEESVNYVVPSGLSWGSLNNTEDSFTGPGAVGMQALSLALIASLLVSIELIGQIVSLAESKDKYLPHDDMGRYKLGSYMYQKQDANASFLRQVTAAFSKEILGIRPTSYPFNSAVRNGVFAYFGLDRSNPTASTATNAGVRAYTDAGLNVVTIRNIIRSSLSVIDAFRQVKGNPISATRSALSIVDVIKSSKLIAACNVFAQLGDAIMSISAETTLDNDGRLSRVDAKNVAKVDVPTSSPARVPKGLTLAWAGQRARSMLMIPNGFSSAREFEDALNSSTTILPQSVDSKLEVRQISGNRLSAEYVKDLETQLDAEYVPFYFHDVRTNEIISFHAFLDSLNDNYSANYETIDAYGRVEPVKIYKSTLRSIDLSFHIVATSHSDLEDMWVKINKLVTLVYPQYTPGKKLESSGADGKYVFTQPFSQLIGASPLVRMRLGDLFKSNYSKFNLARLFGLGNNDFTLGDQTSSTNSTSYEDMEKAFKNNIQEYLNKRFDVFPGEYNLLPASDAGKLQIPGSPSVNVPGVTTQQPTATSPPNKFVQKDSNYQVVVVRMHGKSEVLAECKIVPNPTSTKQTAPTTKGDPVYGDNLYLIPVQSLRFIPKQTNVTNNVTGEFAKKLDEFFDSKNNAIVKSFKDTSGKGLAGFIESISFNWLDAPWATNDSDNSGVVPKMCKVGIKFAPIHDISPGLDHNGYNRAPVYPVLRQSSKKRPQEG